MMASEIMNQSISNMVQVAFESSKQGMNLFQILLIILGIISLISIVFGSLFKSGIMIIVYIYAAVKWIYYKIMKKEVI